MAEDKPIKRKHNFKDITGQRFGRLTVISFHDTIKENPYWVCQCECGRTAVVAKSHLLRGKISCGCMTSMLLRQSHTGHGMSKSREFTSWANAKSRCYNENTPGYPDYGGRGIEMCPEWRDSFESFFYDMGPRPHNTSLNRIDNDGPYAPWNCEWASPKTQSRNTRSNLRITHNGESMTLTEWAERTGISRYTLQGRHRRGSPLFAPVRYRSPRRK